ncbi:hypothetical protein ACJBSI_11330, partial [Streptococcus suis]
MSVTILFTVRPIVFVLITHQIMQSKAVMGENIINRSTRAFLIVLENCSRGTKTLGKQSHITLVMQPKTANI